MTLKEKFDNPIIRHDLGRNEIEETKEQCVEIADEFAIGFAEWLLIIYNEDIIYDAYTKKELLEIYKKEKGL
jgi:hypothetical protein